MAYKHKNIINKKEKNRQLILAYLGNPENTWVNREKLSTQVLKYSNGSTIYVHFSPAELSILENEALILRRSRYAPALSKVDRGILREGAKGNPGSAKLCYQRFEDWTEKKKVEGRITFESVLSELIDVTPSPGVLDDDLPSDSSPEGSINDDEPELTEIK